ncbi:MAG: hypothetical protein AAFQ38_18205 [Pseudomonadota bacterium]
MLQSQPAFLPFAAGAKSSGWRIGSVRDKTVIQFWTFADAALVRGHCGSFTALQQVPR